MNLTINANVFYVILNEITDKDNKFDLELFGKTAEILATSNPNINPKKMLVLFGLYSSEKGMEYFGEKFDLKNLEYVDLFLHTLQVYLHKLDLDVIREMYLEHQETVRETNSEGYYLDYCNFSKKMVDLITKMNERTTLGYIINQTKYSSREIDGEEHHHVTLSFDK